MTKRLLVVLSTLSLLVSAQTAPQLDMADEPHHSLLLKNERARVFRLALKPQEATLPHKHDAFYVYFSLRPTKVSNEVKGRTPVLIELEPDDVHMSKGGFTVAERNVSPEPTEVFVIETISVPKGDFDTPPHAFRYHDSALGDLFETRGLRAYTVLLASGGRTEKHAEAYDRVMIALNDLTLLEDIAGRGREELSMKAGEVRWFPRGEIHATTNIGSSQAKFITFEFN